MRKRLGRDEVTPANLDRIESGRASRLVHEALDDIDVDGPARSPVGPGRRGVRVDADAQELGVLDPVRAEDVRGSGHRRHERQPEQVGAEIKIDFALRPISSPSAVTAPSASETAARA